MNEQKSEQVSALVDDELAHEAPSAIKHLLEDSEARKTWARYHLIGDSMRGHLPERIADIAGNVSQAIDEQPTVLAPQRKSPELAKPVIGFAIAASVAAVAIFNIQQSNRGPAAEQPVIAQSSIATTPSSLATQQFAANQKEQPQVYQNQVPDPRLSRYLVNYNEYKINSGVRGMPPHVRMVANETGTKK